METTTTSTVKHEPITVETPGVSEPSFVDALIDPAGVFAHPEEVVDHPWLTDEEKRTILLSWARDELMAEQVSSHVAPELQVRSRIDAVVEALSRFDASAAGEYLSAASTVRARCLKRAAGRAH
jgi:hypothetical protein